ncbi:enoyl-CoA hydratase-related protein [Dactylosporangium sp. CS-047395]|uniref:enoyl-CoA hydratase-related protein n=1 Tax=Dactylosporangium sp. CS-047395 TaxID=3239936 RepID=UPI003D905CCE
MMDDLLVERTESGVAILTLNRPDALNSLTDALKVALRDTLQNLQTDATVRAVVLTGAGRAFCGGQDLREHAASLEAGTGSSLSTVTEHYNPITTSLAEMPKPVVAAVNGMAAGAGASLALLADFRVGGPRTAFLMAFANVGLAGDTGISWSLPRIVGHAKATELLLLAEPVRAADAFALGMLTRLAESDEDVLPTALELADRLAAGPTVAYAQIKRELAVGGSGSLADALAVEAEAQATCGRTADHQNATASFVNKQKPVYSGR